MVRASSETRLELTRVLARGLQTTPSSPWSMLVESADAGEHARLACYSHGGGRSSELTGNDSYRMKSNPGGTGEKKELTSVLVDGSVEL